MKTSVQDVDIEFDKKLGVSMSNPIDEFKRIAHKMRSLLEDKRIEHRTYQFWIVNALCKAKFDRKNAILELDAGMGKRIIMYMLARIFDKERILIVSPSRASVWDMALKFRELSGSDKWFGIIAGGMPKRLKERILLERRVILATPISLARTLEHQKAPPRFDIIIINEVDKFIRRTLRIRHINAGQYMDKVRLFEDIIKDKGYPVKPLDESLTYPWNVLRKILPEEAFWIGMSGTLRDEHYVIDNNGRIIIRKELDTIVNKLFPHKELIILTMDTLLERTNLGEYITKNLTIIRPLGIEDRQIEIISGAISAEMERIIDQILDRNRELYPSEDTQFKTREKVMNTISALPNTNPLKIKFLRLALARRHIFAGVPSRYVRFLLTPMIRRLIREHGQENLEDILPNKSTKIHTIAKITKDWWQRGQSVIILTSFICTALEIVKQLRAENINNVSLLTGKVKNKKRVLERFRSSPQSVLVLTPVAERDLDFPEASLVIVHDVISTVKSMYQRIKRARRSLVVILYYKNTFEETKVKILLTRIIKRYPWSVRILDG